MIDGAIEVRRLPVPYADRLRAYHVLIDDEHVGTLRHGESLTFPVKPGPHRVQMQIDWTRSALRTVDVRSGETVALECRARNPLGALYWITLGRDRYLRLDVARP